jgi:beta-lactamase class A
MKILLYCCSLLPLSLFSQQAGLTQDLALYIVKLPPSVKISLSVQTVRGQSLFQHRAEAQYPAASVIKIPILVALMKKVEYGSIKLTDTHRLLAPEKIGGSGILMKYPNDTALTIKSLARAMMIYSDNTATNILLNKIGMASVNTLLDSLGMTKTRLNRVMLDTAAVRQGRENYINTLEINTLLQLIYQKKITTKTLCQYMLNFMSQTADRTTIPRFIPPSVKVVHKTGALSYTRGDAAIVMTKNPFILSVFVQGFESATQAEKIIADIGKICWQNLK